MIENFSARGNRETLQMKSSGSGNDGCDGEWTDCVWRRWLKKYLKEVRGRVLEEGKVNKEMQV